MRPTIVVLGLSLAVALGCTLLINRNPVAVSFPIDLKPGATRSATFRPDFDGLHIVGLVADVEDGKRPQCVLGGDAPAKAQACDNVPPVALAWTVFSDNKPVAQGGTASPDRTWQTTYQGEGGVTREIGSVMLKRFHPYQIEVRSLQDARVLAPIHPRIKVQAHPRAFRRGAVILSLMFSISTVAAGLAALRLALLIWRNVRTPENGVL
jgi:hypothetical protein